MKMQQDYMKLKLIEKKTIPVKDKAKDAKLVKEMEMFQIESVGEGHWEHGLFHPVKVKKGDIIYLVAFMSMARDGDILVFGRARDVLAVA